MESGKETNFISEKTITIKGENISFKATKDIKLICNKEIIMEGKTIKLAGSKDVTDK